MLYGLLHESCIRRDLYQSLQQYTNVFKRILNQWFLTYRNLALWRRGVVVITTKPELRLCAGSNPVGDSQW